MRQVLITCMGSAVGVYEVVGVMGYLTFGSKVSSNLISDYAQSRFIALSRLAISFLVLFSYPLQLHPCRASLEKVILAFRREGREGEEEEEDDERTVIAIYVAMTAGLLLASFLIAVNVERLETVLGFVGSTGSTTISYILPSLFYLKLFPAKHESLRSPDSDSIEEEADDEELLEMETERENVRKLRAAAKALLMIGIVVMGVCFSLNVRGAFIGRNES